MSGFSENEADEQRLLDHPLARTVRPFVIGGSSGILATCCIQPIDMIKVRLQLHGEGTRGGVRPTPFSVAREIVARGKFLDLYNGISAGLLRQVVYGTSRLGFFFTFEDLLKQRAERNGTTYGFGQRAAASLTAGGLGAFIGNPVEVALIRMQSDGLKPLAEQARISLSVRCFGSHYKVRRAFGIVGVGHTRLSSEPWLPTLGSLQLSRRRSISFRNGRAYQSRLEA